MNNKSIYLNSDSNNSLIWDKVWNADKYATHDLRRIKAKIKTDLLFKHISIQNNWRIVDLGCGGGYIAEELYHRVTCDITGVDFSQVALEVAKERLKSTPIRFLKSDVCNTNIEDNFADLVICCGIMEHVSDIEKLINEIYRILKPGGLIFITSSNLVSFIWPQRFIKQWLKVWPYGYQKNWTYKSLKRLIENYKIEISYSEMLIDAGDYSVLGFIDRILSIFYKYFGRYIVLWGRKA